MRLLIAAAALLGSALAFPVMDNPETFARGLEALSYVNKRDIARRTATAQGISLNESNCGPLLCPTFSASDQFVTTSGEYVYQSPSVSDIRGPCPGLNAAANHGYLPRNGIASIEQTISGLGAAYNLGPRISAVLAAYAVAIDGNVLEGVWSIGGPLPTDILTSGLLGTGQGLSYSHNNYEGDASIGRNDIYLGKGDAHSLNITKFTDVYAIAVDDGSDRYTLDKFRSRFEQVQDQSIAENPYYFTGLFSTVVVVPAAYNFVINLMSNHSEEEPAGYLDGYNFKTFFGVTGDYPDLVWEPGQEHIPENWYRRPSYAPYEAEEVVGDVLLGYLAYPNTLKFGGNTGTTNSFTGIEFSDLTGGILDIETLADGDNFACFAFQLLQQAIPNFLDSVINDLAPVTSLLDTYLSPITGNLSCPTLGNLSIGLFDPFPGYTYSPTGPDTNY